jgi:hypothetical protein
MTIRTGYCIGPILKVAIMAKIKREGLTIVANDDPIDWYKRNYCLQSASPKGRHFDKPNYQANLIPVFAGQVG